MWKLVITETITVRSIWVSEGLSSVETGEKTKGVPKRAESFRRT